MRNWQILSTLIKTDFIVRYQNSVLGFVWVFLKPFLMFVVLLTIFSVFQQDIPHYPLYLLLGIIVFQFFADGTSFGMQSLLEKRHLILKLPFPRILAVLSSVLGATLHLGFALVLFAGFSLWYGVMPSFAQVLGFVILLGVEFLWILGFALLASLLVIRFRDLGQIWEVLLAALFYLVPIFYPLSIVPDHIRDILWANPLAKIVVWSRDILLYDQFPETDQVALLALAGVGVVFVAWWFFRQYVQSFSEQL